MLDPGLETNVPTLCLSALHMAIKNENTSFKPGSNSRTTYNTVKDTIKVTSQYLQIY